jgi:hypothetical protein
MEGCFTRFVRRLSRPRQATTQQNECLTAKPSTRIGWNGSPSQIAVADRWWQAGGERRAHPTEEGLSSATVPDLTTPSLPGAHARLSRCNRAAEPPAPVAAIHPLSEASGDLRRLVSELSETRALIARRGELNELTAPDSIRRHADLTRALEVSLAEVAGHAAAAATAIDRHSHTEGLPVAADHRPRVEPAACDRGLADTLSAYATVAARALRDLRLHDQLGAAYPGLAGQLGIPYHNPQAARHIARTALLDVHDLAATSAALVLPAGSSVAVRRRAGAAAPRRAVRGGR